MSTCQAEKRQSIALATRLTYWLGHRQGDVLTLTWAQITVGERRIGKTGAGAALAPASYPELAAALESEQDRQRTLAVRPVAVVVMEGTSEP